MGNTAASATSGRKPKGQLGEPGDVSLLATNNVAVALNGLLADSFALYVKTKNFHWHMSGPHFREYHLLLDEQSEQIFAMIDPMAERVRKLGFATVHSIGEVGRMQRVVDNDAAQVAPADIMSELLADNRCFVTWMRQAHDACETAGDVATASLIENWIDETERRCWFLAATALRAPGDSAV